MIVETLPIWLFFVLALPLLAIGAFAPPIWLLCADLVLSVIDERWDLGGVWVDPTDLTLAALVLCLAVRPAVRQRLRRFPVPYLWLWVTLGVLASIAYLSAPQNQQYLTDPVRFVYQLYRYAWKPFIFYPVAIIMLSERSSLRAVLVAMIVAADLACLPAILQGYAGERAMGPFNAPNILGGALVVPAILCLSGLIATPLRSRSAAAFYVISGLLIVRAVTFSGSRGAFAAILAGAAVLLIGALPRRRARSRMLRVIGMGVLATMAVFILKPNLLERPTIERMLSLGGGANDATMQWRAEERWPHFVAIVEAHPWFGVGTATDTALGYDDGNTPHNGYLAMALVNGIPALLVFLALIACALRDAQVLARRGKQVVQHVFAVTVAACLVGVLVHNYVEVTFDHTLVGKLLWILVALAAIARRRPSVLLPQAAAVPPGAPRETAAAPSLAPLGVPS